MPDWILFLFLFAMVFAGVVITELSIYNNINRMEDVFSKDRAPQFTLWNGKPHVLENGVWKRITKNQMIERMTREKLSLK